MVGNTLEDLKHALELLEQFLGDTGSGIARSIGVTPQAYYSLKRGKGVTLNSVAKLENAAGIRLFVINPALLGGAK